MTLFLFFAGFVVLLLGAKFLVDGAASIGKKMGMSQLIVGLTIVALGTSLPELVINVFASLEGSTDLAIGNVIGSNIMNTLLIVGIAAMIFPIVMAGKVLRFDVLIGLLASLILYAMANYNLLGDGTNVIGQADGAALLLFFFLFLVFLFFKSRKEGVSAEETDVQTMGNIKAILLIMGGSVGLFFGGKWIVAGATEVATLLHVSESVVALTLVAGATSLPELVTSVVAAMKKNTDMAVGNAVGSNIFNIFLVLGVSSLITPIEYNTALNVQLKILIAASVLLIVFILLDVDRIFKKKLPKTKRTISSIEGIILVLVFLVFLAVSIYQL